MSKVQRGFSLVEVLLAVSVFGLIVTALVGGLIYGQQSTALSGVRSRAALLADEGLEAVRNIRDANFSNLTDGTFGLITTDNQWNLSGSSDATDIFTRQIVISSVDTNRKNVTANVSWQQNPQRTGTVLLATRLMNWRVDEEGVSTCSNQANNLVADASDASLGAGNKELREVMVENTASSCNIVIDKITVSWTNASRKIEHVKIGGPTVWTGSASSGTQLDVDNTTLNSGDEHETKYRFDGNMSGNTFTITFTMSDGSTKTVSGISP